MRISDWSSDVCSSDLYANMHVVHRRNGQGRGDVVAWISDGTRPFVIVLIQQPGLKDRPLGPIGHLGVACASREDIDRLAARAAEAGIQLKGPEDWGAPVGYWAYIADPDGKDRKSTRLHSRH